MTDKVQKIREEVKKLHGNPYYMMAVNDVLKILDMQEESVNEDFEDAANNALERMLDKYGLVGTGSCLEMFKLGAKWKKENLWKPADGDDVPGQTRMHRRRWTRTRTSCRV